MTITVDMAAARETALSEYVMRFVFGGAITAAAGLIGDKWGPVIAGLFLAFPAIFPASVTLVESRERKKKAAKGLHGERRAAGAGAAYAMGTALGSSGLFAFAATCWIALQRWPLPATLIVAIVIWAGIAALAWFIAKRR